MFCADIRRIHSLAGNAGKTKRPIFIGLFNQIRRPTSWQKLRALRRLPSSHDACDDDASSQQKPCRPARLLLPE
jgi:hypothetical protein